MKLTQSDKELIEIAEQVARGNKDLLKVQEVVMGCALKGKSGKVYKGVNIQTSHSICAEQVAIGQALAEGEREFETIVAVMMNSDCETRVVSPCGLCRYVMSNLNMDIDVIVEDIENDSVLKVKASKLLPYPYKRND